MKVYFGFVTLPAALTGRSWSVPGVRAFQRVQNFINYRIAATLQLLIFFFITVFAFPPDKYFCSNEYEIYSSTDGETHNVTTGYVDICRDSQTQRVLFNSDAYNACIDDYAESCNYEVKCPSYFQLPVILLLLITVLNDGTLKCWGWNRHGQLGIGADGDATSRNTPTAVNLGPGRTAKAVSGGNMHQCAILDDDTLKCWGQGVHIGAGLLGYGDTTQRNAPEATAVVNLGAGRTAKAVAAGSSHTCAILDDDTLKCWGSNYNGRVGVGSSDQLIWDPTEVKFDGSSSSGGSAGAPGPSGLNGTSGAPGPAGPKRDERTFMVATLIVAVIWPVVLYFVRHVHPGTLTARLRQLVGAKPRLLDQPIDVESRL